MALDDKQIRLIDRKLDKQCSTRTVTDQDAFDALFAKLAQQKLFPIADLRAYLEDQVSIGEPPPTVAEPVPVAAPAPDDERVGGAGANRADASTTQDVTELDRPQGPNSDNGVAPYRFVPLEDTVLAAPVSREDLSHGRPLRDGLCGTIQVDWTLETPLLIGEPDRSGRDRTLVPFKLDDDRYAIPGASLRGALRAVLEPATYSRMTRINDHLRFPLRDFDNVHYKDYIMDYRAVRAGWFRRVGTGESATYELVPCQWARFDAVDLERLTYQALTPWVGQELNEKLRYLGQHKTLGRILRVNVDLSDEWGGPLASDSANGPYEARFVVSGKAPVVDRKHYDYVFYWTPPEDPPAENAPFHPVGTPHTVHRAVFEMFHRLHSNQGQDPPTAQGAWAVWKKRFDRQKINSTELPFDTEGWIPVFYAGALKDDPQKWNTPEAADGLWLGLTRLFRAPTKYSVGEVRDFTPAHKQRPTAPDPTPGGDSAKSIETLDFAEALFGTVDVIKGGDDTKTRADQKEWPPRALKSRVMVGFATTSAQDADTDGPHDTTLMGPKPGFYPYYLQNAMQWGYSSRAARLSGWKRYPVRRSHSELPDATSADTRSTLTFLKPTRTDAAQSPVVFSGAIHIHNVRPCELGALLWAMTFGDLTGRLCHALGHAKPFGYGQVSPRISAQTLRRNDGQPVGTAADYIETFKTHIETGVKAARPAAESAKMFDDLPPIRALRAMADPNLGQTRRSTLRYPGDYDAYKEVKKSRAALARYLP